jgi:hypothetical protein
MYGLKSPLGSHWNRWSNPSLSFCSISSTGHTLPIMYVGHVHQCFKAGDPILLDCTLIHGSPLANHLYTLMVLNGLIPYHDK